MYKIKLPNFEGPFDLLLYFIKRDEINIYDIPIARLSMEFLKYVRLMQMLDLDLAGEFIVMAATLMYIKTQMLLPKQNPENPDEIEDPRAGLVQQLLEYKQYKEASKVLSELSDENKYILYRKNFEIDYKIAEENTWKNYKNANVFDLIGALQKVIDRNKITPEKQHIVEILPVTVEEKRQFLINELRLKKRISFFQILENKSIPHIVATFLAILDLLKQQVLFIVQDNLFEDIIITTMPINQEIMEFSNGN
jgi:segregation and condensation protein A